MASPTVDAPLAHWLRLLWGTAPALHLDSAAPFIAGGGIHLPAQAHWLQHCAAAAHAAAHLVYSPARFDGTALVPIARTLLALLEDARVEALALRELPGLARLWRPLHTASPDDGAGCEALMHRLARALVDPSYRDPHPWVMKGRRLFYLDESLALLALRTPQELREAALRLGHDLGQMRLPFNAKGYRPAPAYRDDHRWMWSADAEEAAQPPPQPAPAGAAPEPDEVAPNDDATATWYPEWDRLIRRLRPQWARVTESLPAAQPSGSVAPLFTPFNRRLAQPLQGLTRPCTARGRSAEGDRFDTAALVDWCLARRLHHASDARVYRWSQRPLARPAVCLLIDASASSADRTKPQGLTALQVAVAAAADTALALQALGVRCEAAAFHSQGRLAVKWQILKRGAAPADAAWLARLQALRGQGSTRLGAALRHASARLRAVPAGVRWVLVLSDAQACDLDIHDPQYLVEDARHAVRQARLHGVHLACLRLPGSAPAGPDAARRIFGARGVQTLQQAGDLPRALRRLLV